MEQNTQNIIPAVESGIITLPVQEIPMLVFTPEQQAAMDAEAAAEVLAAEAAAKLKTEAVVRFDTNVQFRLEGQIVGQAFKKKVGKSGAVSLGLDAKKELSKLSGGLKGYDLALWSRMRTDELKGKQTELAARLAGDNNWTGGQVKLSAKGDKLVMEYVKAAPMAVSATAAPTDEQIAKSMNMTVAEVVAMREMKAKMAALAAQDAIKAKADEQAAKELAAAQEAELARMAEEEKAELEAEQD